MRGLDSNDDACAMCAGAGELLCCDGAACPRSWHLACAGLSDEPGEGEWLCPACLAPSAPPHAGDKRKLDAYFAADGLQMTAPPTKLSAHTRETLEA